MCLSVLLPESHSKCIFQFIQIPAKQSVLLRIIIYTKNTNNKFAVSLLQPMEDNIIRNNLILHIYVREHTVAANPGISMHIGNLQITVFPNRCSAAQYTVIARHITTDTAAHFPAPSKIMVLVHTSVHQLQYLPGRSKMNKLRRCQTQELHPVGTQHLPHTGSGSRQFRTEFTFRLLPVKILQRRIRSQRIKKISVKRKTRSLIDISVIVRVCFNQ